LGKRRFERLRKLGPGIITGGAGDDPAGILTYTIVGATTGFSQLWLMLLSAKIALVTGKSLPEILNSFYSKKLTYFVVLCLATANILTIGADLQAVATILEVLTGIKSVYFLVPVTFLIGYLIVY